MKIIELKNIQVLNILNEISDYFTQEKVYKLFSSPPDHVLQRWEEVTSETYLRDILKQGRNHDGFPDIAASHIINYRIKQPPFSGNIENFKLVSNKYGELNSKITTFLGLNNNALWTIYPPGGFISWHNNANAPAYNFVFTWSEIGDGHFKYLDGLTNEIVTIEDKPGWQCKAGYFGSYDDPKEKLCYHSAYTDCLRMTIAYTLNTSSIARKWQDEIIEELETEIL